MYKSILTVLCCCVQYLYACDFCGGAASVMNNDMLSLQPQSSIGVNANYKGFKYLNSENNLLRSHLVSTAITGSYAPKKWVEIKATLPIVWMSNVYANTKDKVFGLSDMSILTNFKAISRSPIGTTKKVGHILIVGFGLELPTGKNYIPSENQLQNIILGSRSVDFLFSAGYSLSYKNWNFITTAISKVNTKNKDKIRYGHLYSMQIGTAYTKTFKKLQLLPNVGMKYEMQQKNLRKNIIQNFTGSKALFLQYGADFLIKNWNLGIQLQHPLVQQTANRTIKQTSTYLLKCTYLIKRNKKFKTNNKI